ncbi:3-hydroxy-3-methylglutaryl-coenzyme A reductase-like [Paramacrobiotus metropolitanus]|uniref:3-hydroxy-3-methylglutaryl-coenzyme A reductase-like n=1 Tax=Paramacrobiotus metropolitanus TaxID=2943436 RepID=UPI002445745B|nr:3-hydroxy-3-methylglutaryl-coenzyme A reductase-like [Paramacrobiotus metropolitanus]XP_055336798.1 3-hydroxy-3-methylglutaryl-coenzyme A reductase-like [Paramacrobiotus metropolitanus]XP_055336799.1 3-hydroxy-3-methylglutaryl-coenzyme A reductase-like [Paramacrobiotus metropolitanus]
MPASPVNRFGSQSTDVLQNQGNSTRGTQCGRQFTIGDNADDEPCRTDLPSETFGMQTQTGMDTEGGVITAPANLLNAPVPVTKIEKLTDEEILLLIKAKKLRQYKLEEELKDLQRAVCIRRSLILADLVDKTALENLPFKDYDYSLVKGSCCENVIGYIPVPVGVAGPLLLDGQSYWVPMATTEGCIVASASRGCRAISLSGGAHTELINDGMTRAPLLQFPGIVGAREAKTWIAGEGFSALKDAFDRTSRFARLQSVFTEVVGRQLHLRLQATTGDAMGMNMLGKGTENALHVLREKFPAVRVLSLSGNLCTDKKPSAINCILGRGKSVLCEAVITQDVLKNVLKTSAEALVELNVKKNLVGSAVAGSIGGCNAHAANMVASVFLATGQDVAQVVESSACLVQMEPHCDDPANLHITCTMPCLEVGTVGGGTNLPAQAACLKLLNVQGPSPMQPGANAEKLARVICGAVLAAELSLLAALTSGDLIESHMRHNRSKLNMSYPTATTGSPMQHSLASSPDPEVACQSGP